jgi:two-component system NtrC family sensor kinase
VESLLHFARPSRTQDRRTFSLKACVEDSVFLFRPQLKGAPFARFETSLDPDVPEVFGDPAQLSQVLLNLLQNGLYALEKHEGTLRVSAGRLADRCFFSVTDSGTGIEPKDLPHIFEPSFTTKPPGDGTGLGLSIAYRIVADHGGTIDVQTRLGAGSTFTVYLPIPLPSLSHLESTV